MVYVLWGSTYLGVKIATETLPPLLISGLRFTIGGGLLWLFALLKDRKWPTQKQMLNAAFLGIMLSGIGNAAISYAIDVIPTGIVALISSTVPLWVFGLNYLFFNRVKPTLFELIGLSMGILGMVLLLNPMGQLGPGVALFPILVVCGGCISWSYATLKSKQLALPASSLQSVAIQMLAGGGVGLSTSALLETNQLHAIMSSTPRTFWAIFYLIVVGSYLGYSAFVWLLNHASPQLTSTYAFVNPVIALLLGWLFLDEKFDNRTLLASGVILAGVMLMILGKDKKIVQPAKS